MEVKFLFWNVRDRDEKVIGKVLDELLPFDIICVAETKISDAYFNKHGFNLIYKLEKTVRGKVMKTMKLYAKTNGFKINCVGFYGNGEIIASLLEFNKTKILLVSVHLISKMSVNNEEKKLKMATRCRNFIETHEANHNVNGSIIFGDFNANPFEKVFTATEGLFSIDLLKPPVRRINKFPYFINATISQMGHFNYFKDGRKKPPGSYYFNNKDFDISTDLFWNSLDGLLFRPSLLQEYLNGKELEIISNTNSYTLYDETTYKIDPAYSDHLPISFTFKFK